MLENQEQSTTPETPVENSPLIKALTEYLNGPITVEQARDAAILTELMAKYGTFIITGADAKAFDQLRQDFTKRFGDSVRQGQAGRVGLD